MGGRCQCLRNAGTLRNHDPRGWGCVSPRPLRCSQGVHSTLGHCGAPLEEVDSSKVGGHGVLWMTTAQGGLETAFRGYHTPPCWGVGVAASLTPPGQALGAPGEARAGAQRGGARDAIKDFSSGGCTGRRLALMSGERPARPPPGPRAQAAPQRPRRSRRCSLRRRLVHASRQGNTRLPRAALSPGPRPPGPPTAAPGPPPSSR